MTSKSAYPTSKHECLSHTQARVLALPEPRAPLVTGDLAAHKPTNGFVAHRRRAPYLPAPVSHAGVAAVDDDRAASHVSRSLAGQIDDGSLQLFRLPGPSHRYLRDPEVPAIRVVLL